MSAQPPRAARFGPFDVDLRAGELRKDGRRIRVQDQQLQVLAALLEQPGEIVTRDELRKRLWPDDTYVDFDHGLNNAINRLREALGDSADTPRYIETIPRRGYRFIAAVERPAPARVRSLAVLPLEGEGGAPDYLVDAVTDALTTELAQLSALHVTSRTSTMRYKSGERVLSDIGRALRVDALVLGAVQRDAERLRVTVELVEAASDRHLAAVSREGDVASLGVLVSAMVRELTDQLAFDLTPDERARLSRPHSINAEALTCYLRAQPHVVLQKPEENEAAIRLLEQAVTIDPAFAAAHAALSAVYQVRGVNIEPTQMAWEEKAYAAAQRALLLDGSLADAYLARGNVLWSRRRHFPHRDAAREYQRAIELNPSCAEARHRLANVYNHVGVLGRGATETQKAAALDPFNVGARFRIGVNLVYQCRYDDALGALQDAQRFDPPLWAFQTAFALLALGRRDEAHRRLTQFRDRYPEDRGGLLAGMHALMAAADGDRPATLGWVREALACDRGFQHFHHTSYVIAAAYARIGDHEPAIQYLQETADGGFPCYPLFVKDANLDGLRDDARFRAFMAHQRAQWEDFEATL